MQVHFTHHAKEKIILIQKYKFPVSEQTIIDTIFNPVHTDKRPDGTFISMSLLDEKHVLRVVYKKEDDIMRKAYGI